MAKPTIVSGKELRRAREEGTDVPLSTSGVWVTLRPVPLDKLLLSGDIPDFLTGIAASVVVEPNAEVPGLQDNLEVARRYIELINLIVPLALVHPRIVDDPQSDDECLLEDFSLVERGEILTLSMQPTKVLERFRDEQVRRLAALSKIENGGQTAEQAS